ncbi:uncharacterized protein LOC115626460 isoform X2 [Scaptodrosophila lebanonensis]|nr:uncharacterized protein LOC115626460 isoform X2 [Scaptodrosophila lebanonensis]
MSRMHFKRTMPETVKFVSQPGWYEMEGYNKVGDNTLPNLLALLTGRTPHQSLDICNVKKPGCFNQLVYLWNHFKNAGYLTAYAEDISSIDTFNYLKRGFDRQPVDFYLRPFMMTVELAMTTLKHFGYPFCIGRRLSFYYVYEFCEQMVKRFISETYRPIFGLFWTNSYTHESYTGATILDDKFAGFLRRFKKLGLFDHSIVILLSDHGYRYGPLVELKDGYLEERLPMLHIYLPPWYRAKYPKVSRALRENRNRLSSVYDLHLALKHVLIQLRPGIEFDRDVGCPKCRPLFKKLPRDRSCEDAGIKEHWCTCQPYAKVQPEFFMEYLAKMVVYRINKLMRMKQYENICYRLQYSRLDMAERKLHFDDGGNVIGAPQGVESYRLKFDTTAKAPQTSLKKLVAKFRVTIKCNRDHLNGVKIHLPFISRLDSYQSETSCVHERIAKKFCFCMDAGAANLAKNTSQELEDTSLFHEDEYD